MAPLRAHGKEVVTCCSCVHEVTHYGAWVTAHEDCNSWCIQKKGKISKYYIIWNKKICRHKKPNLSTIGGKRKYEQTLPSPITWTPTKSRWTTATASSSTSTTIATFTSKMARFTTLITLQIRPTTTTSTTTTAASFSSTTTTVSRIVRELYPPIILTCCT
jgi:hypothetical protein